MHFRFSSLFGLFWLALHLMPCARVGAADPVQITEFMAVNDRTLPDEDGDFPDWIEIHNAGSAVVNLDGWYLTDKATDLLEWRFPATNLLPNAFLIVFASGKDRRVAGAPLHTNFKLSRDGEYLALVRPDGTTIASAFSPQYPPQAADVSYGIPMEQTLTSLIASGATARIQVPLDGSLGTSWTLPGFDDSSWVTAVTGVGYETDGRVPFVPVTLADSVRDFSGAQGHAQWFYGYWNRKSDADGIYAASEFVPFPNAAGAYGPNNYWNGSAWDWFGGDPPFTQLTSQGGKPSSDQGIFNQPEHWAIRRYVSSYEGTVNITGRLVHTSDWVRVEMTGVTPTPFSSLFYIYLTGSGEGYIDDLVLVQGAQAGVGPNLIANGDFENGNLSPSWAVSPNMVGSAPTTTIRHGGGRSLHLVASTAGTTQTNAIWQAVAGLAAGQVYTLSYWYLQPTNNPAPIVRSSGGWIATTPALCGQGVTARVLVDGQERLHQSVFVSSTDYSVAVPVHVGSKIDFALEATAPADNSCDNAIFTGVLQTTDPSFTTVADSVADWSLTGRQGENHWYYGYFNAGSNAVAGVYHAADFVPFPRGDGPHGPSNFWDGVSWKWWNGDPPFDEVGQFDMNPNGLNNGPQHWVIRRWVSELSGNVNVDWTFIKLDACGQIFTCAGVTARVFLNGILRDFVTLPGTNATVIQRSVVLTGVQPGDFIDLALDPMGTGASFGDTGDRSRLTAVIRGSPTLTRQISTDLENEMDHVGSSAYLRIPFQVDDPSQLQFLILRMRYDDGFAAYLNGQLVATANAPEGPVWNSTALASRSDAQAGRVEEFNLTPQLGLLHPGQNILAIHGLNVSADDSDFLILPELVGTKLAFDPTQRRYFTAPTPGTDNGAGSVTLGPIIVTAGHGPNVPTSQQAVLVTARVLPTQQAIGSVQLAYRVMFGNEVVVPMADDGASGDGAAGDGVYGATIPAGAARAGQMLRYYVYATDVSGHATRFPSFADPLNAPEYLGTVVQDPALTNQLPVLHTFARNPVLLTNTAGTRCSMFYDGEFYDNVGVNLHGQTTAFVFPKRSMNVDLNRGYKFRWSDDAMRVNDFDLLTPISDKAYVRQILAYETFRLAGVPTHFCFPVRVQQNGSFFAIFHFVEKGDDLFLDRLGLDPKGALYKVYQPLTNGYAGVAEKKTRQNEPNDDLQQLVDGLNQSSSATRNFMFDNLDVPEVINFLATIQLVQNEDCCWFKNYYLYRDSDGNREWQMMPWDLDLTFGRTFGFFQVGGITLNGYYNTNIYWTNAYYTQVRNQFDSNFIGIGQPLADALFATPATFDMFLRRWSTVQERFLQPTNTHPLLNYYERRVDELAAQISADADLDFAKWGNWSPTQTLSVAVGVLKREYFARRRGWIFNTLRYANGGPYLGPQPTNALLRFGAIDFNPVSGNQAEEFIQVINPNSFSLDISGWRLSGAAGMTFKPGTVMPSNSVLHVSPDVRAFRARGISPHGGQGLFVQGNYQGHLSAWGEGLQLSDDHNRVVASTNYPGNPSPLQQALRITEIMYHPAGGPGGTNADAYEYIELRNIGAATLNLAGARFTAGIDFKFSNGTVTTLGPGQTVLVVKNRAAFLSRYGAGLNIAGEYSGSLDNSGERLRLDDASGEKILEFTYRNDWYRITDGAGFSLVIQDEEAPWDTWGDAASWRPSAAEGGSPGAVDPAPSSIPGLKVNEALTHTDLPTVDSIEIYNPTASAVNLRGWYLSDDFGTPKKFHIAGDVIVPAGGYVMFDEHQFNAVPTDPLSFALSSFGDEVYLFSGNDQGRLTGYEHGFSFGAADDGVSFGRYVTSTGEEHFVPQLTTTLLHANSGPRIGPIVISEILFHPPDNPNGKDNVKDEFVALRNITGTAVALFDSAQPPHTWQVKGGIDFSFPLNVLVPAQGVVLLVSFDPSDPAAVTRFRTRYDVPAGVSIFGPYAGKLDNSGEGIALYRPGVPQLGVFPNILAERIDYRDSAPWPAGADGSGASLQRKNLAAYGNDPANWLAAAPRAGSPSASPSPPAIVSQPASQQGLLSQAVTFRVLANGSNPLRYQWHHNGVNLPDGTNAALVLSGLGFDQVGAYQVTVYNGAGVTESSNAFLTITLPAYFPGPPQNISLRGSTNIADYGTTTNSATFTVLAAGNGPLRYQWRFGGSNIAGANATSLTIPQVTLSNDGYYDVVVTDDFGPIASAPARLTVLLSPTLVQLPITQSVASNGAFTASVIIRGNPPPFYYRWFESSVLRGTSISDSRTNYFSYGPVVNFTVRSWRVIVTNEANVATTANATFFISALPDSDGDGLPDDWESLYFFDPATPGEQDQDADGDGLTNLQEFLAGTNPRDPDSYLRVDALVAGMGTTLTFRAQPFLTYSVQYSEAPVGLPWFKLADVPARTTSRVETLTDPNATAHRFYRLVTPRQP